MNWPALSTDARETVRQVALPLAIGFSERELAKLLGVRPGVVQRQVEALRSEIEAQLAGGGVEPSDASNASLPLAGQ